MDSKQILIILMIHIQDIYIYTSRKPMRCTRKLLKIKSKLILISFVEGQDLATNQFVTRLLQPTT